jgi:hypothetical protein
MQVIRVFRYLHSRNETRVCDLGCKHRVTIHEVKHLTRAPDEDWSETIPYLNYDKPGVGTIRVAYDSDGKRYTQTPSWDGPGPWHGEDDHYWTRPVVTFDAAFDLDDTRIRV